METLYMLADQGHDMCIPESHRSAMASRQAWHDVEKTRGLFYGSEVAHVTCEGGDFKSVGLRVGPAKHVREVSLR
jgi:hypothetical protein